MVFRNRRRGRTIIFTIAIILVATFSLAGISELIGGDERLGEDVNIQVAVMEYIKENHPEAAVFIGEPSEMVWSLNSSQIMVGYSRYVYTSEGWKMIIGHATTPKHVYEVRAEYDERIVWTGIVEDGEITETGYTPHCTDLNGDGEVNICDVSSAARAFGSKEGDTNWNPKADIAEPFGEINILDLVKVVRDFGKTA